MCRVKTGVQIREIHDIQNLVTANILRSQQPYSIADLSKKIMQSCIGAAFPVSDRQIVELVHDTTMALLRAKYISSSEGCYYAEPIASLK